MRLVTIIIASLCLAASAFGAIYETPEQFEPGKPTTIKRLVEGSYWMTWTGSKVTHSGIFEPMDRGHIGTFEQKGLMRCAVEIFVFAHGHEMSNAEFVKFMQPYIKAGMTTTADIADDGVFVVKLIVDRDGKNFGAIGYDRSDNTLHVMTMKWWERLAKAMPTLDEEPKSERRDCLIVATEAYARLNKTALWAKIAGFIYSRDGKKGYGHAVVFFQPTEDSNVFMYDDTGGYELPTRSHELTEILNALNEKFGAYGIRISEPKWLGGV